MLVVSQFLKPLPNLDACIWVSCQQESSRSVMSNIPPEALRWRRHNVLFSLWEKLMKSDDLSLGLRKPNEFKVSRN